MFSNIKTSKANKEIVTNLTNKLNLGAENIIARIAFAHSLSTGRVLDVHSMKDSGGKEYSSKVLFGDYIDYYAALIAITYGIYKSDKDIPKYFKMHIDDGLELLNEQFAGNSNATGFDLIASLIDTSLLAANQ